MSSENPVLVIDRIATDRKVVFEFFAVFSRFECALKRTPEFLAGNDKTAEANWDKYANSLRGRFSEIRDPAFTKAVSHLLTNPPRKQVVEDGGLRWKQSVQGPSESNEAYVLRLVRTVRNNLFHGGKYPYPEGPVEDVTRNRELLNSSLNILVQCLKLSPNVDAHYQEAA